MGAPSSGGHLYSCVILVWENTYLKHMECMSHDLHVYRQVIIVGRVIQGAMLIGGVV